MKPFVGTWRLIRLALRRDRIVLPITIFLVVLMSGGGAPALADAYPDREAQLGYVVPSVTSIAGRLFQGTIAGVNLGTILTAETFLFTSVILAIMSIFIVTRHTRHNEEIGAGELIGSGIVGRSAPLTAALLVAIGTNIITALMMLAIISTTEGFDVSGAAFYSFSLAAVGIFFGGIAAITAQLSDYRRGANGMAVSLLIGAFLVRGVGDALGELSADGLSVTANWISWLSPLGWAYQVLPFNENRLGPLVLLVVVTMMTFSAAYFLRRKRDLGSSIFESKPGPNRAKSSLLSGVGLAHHLQKGGLYGWLTGFAATGLLIGVIANDFKETFTENEVFNEFLEASGATGSITDIMFASMFPLSIALLSGYAVTAISKMQAEESSGRIEYLLSTTLGRIRWMFSHIGYIATASISFILLFGLIGALGFVFASEEATTSFGNIILAAAVNIPAMLVFLSVILFVFAFRGKFVKSFAWIYYSYIALIGSIASIFTWPDWVSNLSPFAHSPTAPSESIVMTPIYVLMIIFISLLLLSMLVFSRRDLSLSE